MEQNRVKESGTKISVDLKKILKTKGYGTHQITINSYGEGFRGSMKTKKTVSFVPYAYYSKSQSKIVVTNIIPGIESYEIYINDILQKNFEHESIEEEDLIVDMSDQELISDIEYKFKIILKFTTGDSYTVNCSNAPIYGVTGLGPDATTTALERTDQAVGKTYSISSSTGICTSDFDNLFPYSQFTEYTDEYGNEFISIPSMWFRIGTDESNNITDIAVSEFPDLLNTEERWVYSPKFYVGKYLLSQETYYNIGLYDCSKVNKSPTVARQASVWQSAPKLNDFQDPEGEGYIYHYFDVVHSSILKFLYLIEFANRGYLNSLFLGGNGTFSTGYSYADVSWKNGSSIKDVPTAYNLNNYVMKYRGIEEFSKGWTLLSGAYQGYYATNPYYYYDFTITNKKKISAYEDVVQTASSGYVHALGWDDELPFICMPSVINSTSTGAFWGQVSGGTAEGDNSYIMQGCYNRNNAYGLFGIVKYKEMNRDNLSMSRLMISFL